MADVEELAAGIGANRAAVTDSAGAVAASRSMADELSATLAGLGITDRTGELAEVSRQLDEVHARLTGVAERLGEIQQAAAAAGGLPTGADAGQAPARPGASPIPPGPRPDTVAAVRRMGWPRNKAGRMTTTVPTRGHC